jgi:hypothetical protein
MRTVVGLNAHLGRATSSLGQIATGTEHTYSRTYYSNQLVATYASQTFAIQKKSHKTVAELKEDGTITWKTTPRLLLKNDGNGIEGQILQIAYLNPQYYIEDEQSTKTTKK